MNNVRSSQLLPLYYLPYLIIHSFTVHSLLT